MSPHRKDCFLVFSWCKLQAIHSIYTISDSDNCSSLVQITFLFCWIFFLADVRATFPNNSCSYLRIATTEHFARSQLDLLVSFAKQFLLLLLLFVALLLRFFFVFRHLPLFAMFCLHCICCLYLLVMCLPCNAFISCWMLWFFSF